jgi:hypothetical protein
MRTSPPDPSRRHSSEICPSDVRYCSGQEQQGHCASAAGWDGRAALQVPRVAAMATIAIARPESGISHISVPSGAHAPASSRAGTRLVTPQAAPTPLCRADRSDPSRLLASRYRSLCGPTVAGIGTTVAQVAPAAGSVEPASPAIRPRSARVPPGRCPLWPQNRAMRRLSRLTGPASPQAQPSCHGRQVHQGGQRQLPVLKKQSPMPNDQRDAVSL